MPRNDRPTLRTAITFAADAPTDQGFLNPAKLSDEERLDLIEKARDGKVLELRLAAEIFWDKPNANHFRIMPGTLGPLVDRANTDAASSTPPQLLLEHIDMTFARVGHWTGARLVERDGAEGVVAELAITDPDAQEDFLRRKLDRFSIGFARPTSVECSVCGVKARSWWATDCEHQLGVAYAEGLCEAIITTDAIEETSFTGAPAVEGTAILAAQRHTMEGDMPTNEDLLASQADAEELAAFRASKQGRDDEIAAMKVSLEAANTAVFGAMFDASVGQKVLASEREDMRILFDAKGAEGFAASLSARPNIVGHEANMVGAPGGTPDESAGRVEPDVTERVLDTLAFARRHGILKNKVTRESLEASRYGAMRFDGANRKVG